MKKYTAKIIGYNPSNWTHIEEEIQVDSEEEAREWCSNNSSLWTCDYHLDRLVENNDK